MKDIIALGVSFASTGIGIGIATYLRHMRQKAKRSILRSEKIRRYYR